MPCTNRSPAAWVLPVIEGSVDIEDQLTKVKECARETYTVFTSLLGLVLGFSCALIVFRRMSIMGPGRDKYRILVAIAIFLSTLGAFSVAGLITHFGILGIIENQAEKNVSSSITNAQT